MSFGFWRTRQHAKKLTGTWRLQSHPPELCRSLSLRAPFPGAAALPGANSGPLPKNAPKPVKPQTYKLAAVPKLCEVGENMTWATVKTGPIGYEQWKPGMSRRACWPLFGLQEPPALPAESVAIAKEFFERGAKWLGDHEKFFPRSADYVAPPTWVEVAVMGRSNVGKSSLLNALVGRPGTDVAPVSKRPGSTVALDFYGCGTGDSPEFVLVDTPGYGYSSRGKATHTRWMASISHYLRARSRNVLMRVIVLIDARHGIMDSDKEVLKMLDDAMLPCHVVLTKADEATEAQLEAAAMQAATSLAKLKTPFPLLNATSAKTAFGIPELKVSLVQIAKLHRRPTGAAIQEQSLARQLKKAAAEQRRSGDVTSSRQPSTGAPPASSTGT